MSNILNLVNHRTVALASLGACASIAAAYIYSRASWSLSKIEETQQQAAELEAGVEKKVATISACTTASSDSGLTSSDGVFDLQACLEDLPVRVRRGRGDSGIVDDSVAMEMDGMEAARELELIAGAVCQDSAEPVAKDFESAVRDFETVAKDLESVGRSVESIAKLSHSVAMEANLVAKEANLVAKEANLVIKDAPLAPSLTPQFIEARLRVLCSAPDNASLMLAEGDADVLTKRLALLDNSAKAEGADAEAQLVEHLQLIGRLLLAQQRAEPLCRSGSLYQALAEVYEQHSAGSVEIRVRCILALTSARAAAASNACSGGGGVDLATDLRLAPLLADDAVASDRLRPHALRLLGQLGPACHPVLTGRLPALLGRLRRLGNSDTGTAADDAGFCLIAGQLARMLTDAACRRAAFAADMQLASVGEVAPPSIRRLKRDLAVRTAWLDLLAALASESSRQELTAIWWPLGIVAAGKSAPTSAGKPIALAAAIQAQVSDVYKQVKKLAGGLKSSEKRSAQGQRLLAVKKDVKALKHLAKHRPKPAKKK